MKNRTRSTLLHTHSDRSQPVSAPTPFGVTRRFLAMKDIRPMLVAFVPCAIASLGLLTSGVLTNIDHKTVPGFMISLVLIITLTLGVVFAVMLLCLLVDIIVFIGRTLVDVMGRMRHKSS